MDQVEEDGSFISALEDEAIELESLLVEPKNDSLSVNDAFCLDKESLEKCMEIEGGLDSNTTQEGEDGQRLEVLDVRSHEVEGVGNLQAANGLSCICEDYFLDIEFAESVPKFDYDSSEGLHSGISGSESLIPGFSRSYDGSLGISELSTAIISVPEYQNDLLNETICELHHVFSSICGCQTPVKDEFWVTFPTSFELQKVDNLDNISNLLERGISAIGNGNDMISTPGPTSGRIHYPLKTGQNNEVKLGQGITKESLARCHVSKESAAEASNSGALPTHKRLRKPPRRYIEESSYLNSGCCRRRQEMSSSTSKDKFLRVRSLKHQHMGSRATTLVSEEPICEYSIQVPFGSPVREECRMKHASIRGLNSDEELSPAESEDDFVRTIRYKKGGNQRKHHRLWTLSEVKKLIDGVSQYGVGRWTDIKRLLFSSSAHRTPVDLKDKWRNLLRASCVQKTNKSEVEYLFFSPIFFLFCNFLLQF
ncbi:hypothetical protein F0562_016937 [Nyssa sinensis]|uniref:Uncharacterized protein n=1 Tax=Nyssa sinensis TaxID=561372 RepID=A0A5J4ZH74_9ASTE|nr:hypothetical protein F0562_016937 [Nyssa sinensis]